jgi:hypothetical protein
MKWLLVVLVMNSPVKTDMVFDDLGSCLAAEEQMRAEWANVYNRAQKNQASPDSLALIKSQMTSGTCIPTASQRDSEA